MGIVVVEDENWSSTSAMRQKIIIEPQLEKLTAHVATSGRTKKPAWRNPVRKIPVGLTSFKNYVSLKHLPSAATQTCAVQCECPRIDCWYACVPLLTSTFFRHFSLPVIEGHFVFFNIPCVNIPVFHALSHTNLISCVGLTRLYLKKTIQITFKIAR